jgi:hypothetical protein
MNKKSCICETCGKEYFLFVGEINRKLKKGTHFYCSRSCSGKANCSHFKKWIESEENKNHIKKFSHNKVDEYSNFRETLKRCRYRAKNNNKELNLTLFDLKDQWQRQEGKCPYLNQPLILPLTTRSENKENPNLIASLDRIDSSKGYVKDNIQFISQTLNFAKNKFDQEILLNLIDLVRGV